MPCSHEFFIVPEVVEMDDHVFAVTLSLRCKMCRAFLLFDEPAEFAGGGRAILLVANLEHVPEPIAIAAPVRPKLTVVK